MCALPAAATLVPSRDRPCVAHLAIHTLPADRNAYLPSLEEELVQHMKTILMEKPANPKAKLVELLNGGDGYYVFNSKGNEASAKGGKEFDKRKAAILFIEYQNEFTTVGGKMHDAVKGNMEVTGMLSKSATVAEACRKAGMKVMHAGAPGQSNNCRPSPTLRDTLSKSGAVARRCSLRRVQSRSQRPSRCRSAAYLSLPAAVPHSYTSYHTAAPPHCHPSRRRSDHVR